MSALGLGTVSVAAWVAGRSAGRHVLVATIDVPATNKPRRPDPSRATPTALGARRSAHGPEVFGLGHVPDLRVAVRGVLVVRCRAAVTSVAREHECDVRA